MALVLTTIYMGTPGDLEQGAAAAVWILVGGAVYLMAILPGWPGSSRTARDHGGARIAGWAWQHGDRTTRSRPQGWPCCLPAHTTRCRRVTPVAAPGRRADALIDDAEKARQGLIALGTDESPAAMPCAGGLRR